ncbi:hypothetical protein [Pseudolactococcus reticulitermitis]|uniref:Uncharacterized protein n=1 Tax=Pseudolactococcus reticulitermitis TaxID=2025039 RepID=A0A224WYZ1_9LACT|nr:hypothetical protein [Lactococcus reticulitermitis]GAX47319.1 hypothetical protein RsY01_918 [Lactococcus reticulitermitis]
MSKKQAAWLRVLVMIALVLTFIIITVRLFSEYSNLIPSMVLGVLLIIPGLPIIIWVIIAALLYVLLKLAIMSLIKTYDTYNVFDF